MDNDKVKDFSLVLGGPLYQFYLRTFLATPPLNLCERRVTFITLFTWLPLMILTVLAGQAFSGVRIPFFLDFDTHARFLLSLAVLISAEVLVHKRMSFIVRQFVERDLITKENESHFNRIIDSAMSLRNSMVMELLLILFVYTGGHWLWKEYVSLDTASWFASRVNGLTQLTPAGYWYVFVSLPLFQFILVRWYFRIFIWYRFLWQVSKLPLNLNALHPDRSGGLGFLSSSMYALSPILIAHTILLSGLIANRSWNLGVAIIDYKLEVIGALIFLTLLVFIPLMFFLPSLIQEKRQGLRDYGIAASHYVNDFYQKWMGKDPIRKENFLGSSDIQSLADLANSFQVVREMRAVPASTKAILKLIIVIALPLVPLVISMAPLDKVLERLLGVLF